MNKYLDQLKQFTITVIVFIKRYSVIIFFLIFAGLAGFLVMRIGELSRAEPSQMQIDEKIKDIPKAKIDDDVIAKLRELQDKNISIEALFDNGRTNPFEN